MEVLAAEKWYRLIHIHGCWNLYFLRDDIDFSDELTIRSDLSAEEFELLTETDAFYDELCGLGQRPTWNGQPPPDVSRAPWQVL